MERWKLFQKVCKKLRDEDPDDVVDILGVNSDQLVTAFEDIIDDDLESLRDYFDITEEEDDDSKE